MMGSESHPLESNAKLSDSMENVTLDPLGSHSNETYTLVASPVSTHPLDPEGDGFLVDDVEEIEEEVKKAEVKKVEQGETEEEDDRIISIGGADRWIHHQPPAGSNQEFLNIIVTNPQKEAGGSAIPGGNSFVTYLVSVRTNMQEYGAAEHNVRRRFKDVVALADSFVNNYRGYFIPSRPDKNNVEGQFMDKHDFIEQRRIGIEKYLRRLAAHPVLRKSEELRTFLVTKGRLPFINTIDVASRMLDGAARLPKQLLGEPINLQEVVRSAKVGKDLLRMFKELKQSVTNDWGASRPPVVEEDTEFLEKKERLKEYEKGLLQATQKAEELLKAQDNLARVMGDHLGLSVLRLTKFETQNASGGVQQTNAENVKRLANAIIRGSRLQKGAFNQASRHLEGLSEHLAQLQSAHTAFAERDYALLTLQTLMSDIAVMHTRAEKQSVAASKTFGVDKNKDKKADELKESIRVTEEACECAKQKYEEIKANNRTELDRLEKEKQSEFLQMLRGFVQSQVGSAEKLSKEWSRVVDEFAEYSPRRVESPFFKSNVSFTRSV